MRAIIFAVLFSCWTIESISVAGTPNQDFYDDGFLSKVNKDISQMSATELDALTSVLADCDTYASSEDEKEQKICERSTNYYRFNYSDGRDIDRMIFILDIESRLISNKSASDKEMERRITRIVDLYRAIGRVTVLRRFVLNHK